MLRARGVQEIWACLLENQGDRHAAARRILGKGITTVHPVGLIGARKWTSGLSRLGRNSWGTRRCGGRSAGDWRQSARPPPIPVLSPSDPYHQLSLTHPPPGRGAALRRRPAATSHCCMPRTGSRSSSFLPGPSRSPRSRSAGEAGVGRSASAPPSTSRQPPSELGPSTTFSYSGIRWI